MAGPELTRRGFLAGVGATLVLAACSSGDDGPSSVSPVDAPPAPARLDRDPFTLGVASGDPLADRVILWTRLAPDPRHGGGMPPADVRVAWDVALDEDFASVVRSDLVSARAERAHAVHVDADGLQPDTWYHYRFRVGRWVSPTGRTRTTPSPDTSPETLRFAVLSCQDYQEGHYTAYPHLADEGVDLVLFLGDYIYEDPGDPSAVRPHGGTEPTTLDEYRDRYAIYKRDPSLQAVHAACPWIVVWDDHEVENNYAGLSPQDPADSDTFAARRRAAYQAWYEHQPVRVDWTPTATPIHRSFTYGDLASVYALDTRQHRTDQPCNATRDLAAPCPATEAEEGTLLGDEQEAWLFDQFAAATSRWNLLAQQVVFSAARFSAGELELFNLDQWDGYRAARRRVLDALQEHEVPNPVLLCGDVHTSVVADVQADPTDFESAVVASELGGTSVTSTFPEELADLAVAAIAGSPDVKLFDPTRRGYLVCELTPDRLLADFRLMATTERPASPIAETSSWIVEAGRPGPRPA